MNTESTAYIPAEVPADAGQTCTHCGYDLTGLSIGSPCPECGKPFGAKKTTPTVKTDSINHASRAYLRRMSISMLVMGTTGLLVFTTLALSVAFPAIDYAVRFLSIILNHQNASQWASGAPSNIWQAVISAAVILVCASYALSTLAVFAPRADATRMKKGEPFGTIWSNERRIAVISQCAWVLVALLAVTATHTGIAAFAWLATLVVVLCLAGIAPTAWLLGDIAVWSNEHAIAMRCRASVCMMGIGAVYITIALLLLAVGSGAGLFLTLFSWIFGLTLMLGVYIYFASALQLAASAHWAIINAKQESERDARMAERARERADQSALQPQPTFPAAVSNQLADEIERKHRQAQQDPDLEKARDLIGRSNHRVIGHSDGETYALEDEQNPDPDA